MMFHASFFGNGEPLQWYVNVIKLDSSAHLLSTANGGNPQKKFAENVAWRPQKKLSRRAH